MNYDQFDKTTLKVLRAEMQKALDKAGLGNLEFEIGNMKYSSGDVTIQVKAKIEGKQTFNQKLLEDQLRFHNLKKEASGRTLVEYMPRNHKYPFIFEKDGKRFKCSLSQARIYFAA